MPISMNSLCIMCRLRKDLDTARSVGDDATATEFAKAHMQMFLDMPEGVDSAYFGARLEELFQKYYGLDSDRYRPDREQSNRFVLERMELLRSRAKATEDPVYAGLQLATLGNYIDFSALRGEVDFRVLDEMLDKGLEMELDRATYARFCKDLEEKKKLLILTDNAGEIGFDRLLAELLKEKYPHLEILFCVRGGPVSNDAIREDAQAVGITFPVIDSGCAIGGTVIRCLGEEAKQALEDADVILAKGMGNTESMFGCGYNVYYAFLIKCDRFIQYFGKPKLTPMFVHDGDKV